MAIEGEVDVPEVGKVTQLSEEQSRMMNEGVQERMRPYLKKNEMWHREMRKGLKDIPALDGINYAA